MLVGGYLVRQGMLLDAAGIARSTLGPGGVIANRVVEVFSHRFFRMETALRPPISQLPDGIENWRERCKIVPYMVRVAILLGQCGFG